VGDIVFKAISATENSNKFQKIRFWQEKSVEDVVTLECLPFNSGKGVVMCLWCCWKDLDNSNLMKFML
jgi:hypothetical protein